jgi:diadenosine tetraphosphate (Ap4A) HIT family hydrolase
MEPIPGRLIFVLLVTSTEKGAASNRLCILKAGLGLSCLLSDNEENKSMNNTDCLFCVEFDNIEISPFRRLFPREVLADRIIKSTQNFVALAGLGALRPGYVLILPKKHMLSFAFLDQEVANEAEMLKADLIQQITFHFSDLIVFEHGPVSDESPAGGCISHAHLHLFPTAIDLFPRLSDEFQYTTIKHTRELAYFREAHMPYIYYQKAQNGFAFAVNHPLPSQYMRRILWEAEGRPDEWDWELFLGYEDLVRTVRILGSVSETDI